MPYLDAEYPRRSRVVVEVYNGVASATMDKGVDWELIDWDEIRTGDRWDATQIDEFAQWAHGLPRIEKVLESLRYECLQREDK